MLRKKRFLIGGIILFLAIGYLGYMGFEGAATYYYTVSELLEQGHSIYGETVRVNGQIASGSVEQEAASQMLRFSMTDGNESLPVVYHGAVPDSFRVGNEVVIEGYLDSAGVFQANTILTKCPSRYVPKQ